VERHRGVVAVVDRRRGGLAPDLQPGAAPADPDEGGDDGGEQEQRRHAQLRLAEEEPQERQCRACPGRRPAALGEHQLAVERETVPGTSRWSRISAITWDISDPLITASGRSAIRWASTGTASCLTSSGRTKSRPAAAAHTRESRSRNKAARVDAPRRMSGWLRVASTMSMM